MNKVIGICNSIVWGAPALILILGVGLYLSVRLHFSQIRLFPRALTDFWKKLIPGKRSEESRSSYRALCTALSATVGTGNLVGVAGAICLGGPGAIFWMWICALAGMITKYAEATLSVRYRLKTKSGYSGGPMYIITQGMGERWRPLAILYSLCGLLASFGVGNAAQVNSVVTALHEVMLHFGKIPDKNIDLFAALIMAFLIGTQLLGGRKRIASATEKLIPFAAAAYILLCLGVLAVNWKTVPSAFLAIVRGAFSPEAVTGGMLGSAFQALRTGCSRGVFTNEAGMGTAAIAHSTAQVKHPVQQGLMGIVEVFLDTIVICTLTALVILVSGVRIPYGIDVGAELTAAVFEAVYGDAASVLIAIMLILFAVASILGWSYYGGSCLRFLFGSKYWIGFVIVQMATIVFAAVSKTEIIWQFSELVNGLMAIPNLIALAVLTPEIVRLTKEYKEYKMSGRLDAGGGYYADFYKCKPL